MPVDLEAEERYLAALCELGSKPSDDGGARRLGRLWLLASLLCAAWLVVSLTVVGPASRAAAPLGDLQDPAVLVAWLRATAVLGVLRFAEFFLWGSLVSLAVGYARPARLPEARQLAIAALLTLAVAAGMLFLGDSRPWPAACWAWPA
jgi:hypothetical protein